MAIAMRVPAYPLPTSLRQWRARRRSPLRTLRRLLGAVPPRPRPVVATTLRRSVTAGYVREDLVLHDGATGIPAALVLPRTGPPPYPAVLFHHSHWGDYAVGLEELFQPWPVPETPAGTLARRGFAVLAIDAQAFGGRQGRGPGGPGER